MWCADVGLQSTKAQDTAVLRIVILFLAYWFAFQMEVTSGKAFFWFACLARENKSPIHDG